MSDTGAEEERQAEGAAEHDQDAPTLFVSDHEMPCPICGSSMPDLKGGKESICPNCGFKDSCCF